MSRFVGLLNYQQKGSKLLILMTIVIISIAPIIIILSSGTQAGQRKQKSALGFKTAFCEAQVSGFTSRHETVSSQ